MKTISRPPLDLKRRKEQGQLTLFFAMTMLLLITAMAFIINVGLFVKARINLQNAVDAAAWSGAAVQARQLTNVAFLNWEMRNVYKEWMFKYYILGQVALSSTNPASSDFKRPNMSFRMQKFQSTDQFGDDFNLPSICMHFAGTTNICQIYTVPGLPRFGNVGFPGLDETNNRFVDTLVEQKSADCSKRTELNFRVANAWAYGVGSRVTGASMRDLPQVAVHVPGAWPKAIELAIRMRNLEKIVNEPPKTICNEGSTAGNCQLVTGLHQQPGGLPLHERSVKAFWSAYRNLENNDPLPNLKQSFVLTELSPVPFKAEKDTLSGLLQPGPADKYYLDLRLNLLNLVTFYTAFTASSGSFGGTSVQSQAQCSATKTALPVPGYPFGFDKNPEVITYYAVKGEAEYTGLFNPFENATKLVAYAAAKPFGGRIGPQLFRITPDEPQLVRPRSITNRSYPYLSGLDPNSTESFKQGYPMPLDQNFWIRNSSSPVGGRPQGAQQSIKFGIPNLLYDIVGDMSLQGGAADSIQTLVINPWPSPPVNNAGLYSSAQFEAFRKNLPVQGGGITANIVEMGLRRSRAPTAYEALNYLIPTRHNISDGIDNINTVPVVPADPSTSGEEFSRYTLFAPLYGEGTWYPALDQIKSAFNGYLDLNFIAIDAYEKALKDVAIAIVSSAPAPQNGVNLYQQAAESIHNDASNSGTQLTCSSIAGKFVSFYKGTRASPRIPKCPGSDYLEDAIIAYWVRTAQEDNTFQSFYVGTYATPQNPSKSDALRYNTLMTAYLPGTRQGADDSTGVISHPFLGQTYKTDRNYYSTKLIPIQSLISGTSTNLVGSFTVYSEGTTNTPAGLNITQFQNLLDLGKTGQSIIRVKN